MDKADQSSDVPARLYEWPVNIGEGDIICGYELDDMRYAIIRAMEATVFNNAWIEDGMAYFNNGGKRWVAEIPPQGRNFLERYYSGCELDETWFFFIHIRESNERE